MSVKIKNIGQAEIFSLKDQISYQDGQIVSKTLAQNDALSITLFSFAKGEEISTHASGGDAMVTCLDGKNHDRRQGIYSSGRGIHRDACGTSACGLRRRSV